MMSIFQSNLKVFIFVILGILLIKLVAAVLYYIYDKVKDNRLEMMNQMWEIERLLAKGKISYKLAREQQNRIFSLIKKRKYPRNKQVAFKHFI